MSGGGNIIQAMLEYGQQFLQAGMEGDADKVALTANLAELYRARAYAAAQAVDSERRGAIASGRLRMDATELEGRQRVAFAVGNVDATSGTAAGVIGSSRLFAELDSATALNNAKREALGHRIHADQLDFAAEEQKRAFRMRNTKRIGDVAGAGVQLVGSVLSTAMGGM